MDASIACSVACAAKINGAKRTTDPFVYRAGVMRRNLRHKYGRNDDQVVASDLRRLFDEAGGRCRYCGAELDRPLFDHVTPLARGGEHHPSNLVPCCLPCNMSKGVQYGRDPQPH
jgi:5-methylcytosine-specific restriction endonuclease McrA